MKKKWDEIPWAIYGKNGIKLLTVVNEIFERYAWIKLKQKFWNKFKYFEEHPSIQVANYAIEGLFIERNFSGKNWSEIATELNKYYSYKKLMEAYTDIDNKLIKWDENKILRNNPDLQKEIA